MSRFWRIPRQWADPKSPLFILGGGPTLPDTLGDKDLSAYKVIGVNESAFIRPWVDLLFFGDARWYQYYIKEVNSFSGTVATYNRHPELLSDKIVYSHKVNVVNRAKGKGICPVRNRVRFNRSSGGAAINLAYHLGARLIVLVGYDMRQVNGEKNWSGEHPWESDHTKEMAYDNFLLSFVRIARDARSLGMKIFNATPDSALKEFPFADLGEFV